VAAGRAHIIHGANAAEIGRLTVVPDLQGQGLGTSLILAIEERLPTDVQELRLFTGERSEANLRLYARLGYSEVEREPTPEGYALVHLCKARGTATRSEAP